MFRGDFGDLFSWPIMGIHAILTPDNKVLTFGTDKLGRQGGSMFYDVWDPATNVHHTLDNISKVDMFCAVAMVVPATGKIMIAGGDARPLGQVNYGITNVMQYDYRDETLVKAPDGELAFPRWYPTAVTLANGSILVLGGRGGMADHGNAATTMPELYTPGVGWKTLTGAGDQSLITNWYYPRTWVKSNGEVIYFAGQGNTPAVYSIDPTGDGHITKIKALPFGVSATMPAIMYQQDKVLMLLPSGILELVDIHGAVPTFTKVGNVGAARYWSNMTVLADGKVMISGGSGARNELTAVTNQVAIWDPKTKAVTLDDTAAVARLYHSTTLMLPDGTVLSLGGGAPGPLNNRNGEIYTPGYLLDANGQHAERPVITMAPTSIKPLGTFKMTVDDPSDLARITFVKNGSVTHSFNMDTRFLDLTYQLRPDGTLIVNQPDNGNLLTPGNWMLFAIDKNGVPSVSKTVTVTIGGQTLVPAAKGYATLSGDASETGVGSFKLAAAPEGNRGAVLFDKPVDLAHDQSFAFDVKLGYCSCGDGVTFLLQSNAFGENAPSAVIDSGGLRLEIGKSREAPGHAHDHVHAGEAEAHTHVEEDEAAHAEGGHAHGDDDGTIPGDAVVADPEVHDTHWRLTKAAKAELAQSVWHRVAVFWDAEAQRLSYTIDGKFAGELTGDVLDRFLGGRTKATFGFVGARLADGTECHEVRLVGTEAGGAAARVLGGLRGTDHLAGGAADDALYGARGADVLRGGAGDDTLHPGRGGDLIFGGAGADHFVFTTAREAGRGGWSDTIADFRPGHDVIDLAGIDADRKAAGDQAFHWLGDAPFSGHRGELRFADGILTGDIHGHGKGDFAIHFDDIHALAASDVLL